ncbi:alpha/beta hydrolase [Nocardioides eburneiflavus]|uniref:Alpha/beta hydrolase n=1 Tax=Nocardioides eburneiflavus TaxID=2518372 RepID=A0A4Z1CJC8_9ACTN|nr:alpha/beta hydrolase [Nocardioides eburneiflavus]TGN63300.1 alpha/beta hydrolase [Nocardioides eburneiflavus]
MDAWPVIFLPGVVMPASAAFANLLAELGADVDAVTKDLEVYATSTPPSDYSLDVEVAGVLDTARVRGWDRFHLVGYSAGAAVALAFAAAHAERLGSLGLLEPAWAGNWSDASASHRALWREYVRVAALTPEESMPAFVRMQLQKGVEPPQPPPGPPPPWMAQRPAGIRAIIDAFMAHDLDRDALRRFDRPVYFALGGLSNPDQFRDEAERLARVFDDFSLEVFPLRHHFDPPHRAEPSALATSLRRLWQRSESISGTPPEAGANRPPTE